MNQGMYISASAMMTQMARQDVFANNLANVSTTAFQPDSIYMRQRGAERIEASLPFLPSNMLLERLGGGVMPTQTYVGTKPGALESTERSLDLGIEGEGYFVVRAGPGEQGLRLSRDGRLALNSQGWLVTASGGFEVLGDQDQGIQIDPSQQVVIQSDGTIMQNGSVQGRLQLVQVSEPHRLIKSGSGLLKAPGDSLLDRTPAPGQIRQGHLEQSGVNAIQTLMDVEGAARSAQGHARILGYYDELMGQVIGLFGRVN